MPTTTRVLCFIVALLMGGCAHQARSSQDVDSTKSAAPAQPWPAPLHDTWRGTIMIRQLLMDSLEWEKTDSVTLVLRDKDFDYRTDGGLEGRGLYQLYDYDLEFFYLHMDRIPQSPYNIEGRFGYYYLDSVLILEQREAVGQLVKKQVFMDKELKLRRVKY